jgi:uncharacterized protein (TIGR01370 family)
MRIKILSGLLMALLLTQCKSSDSSNFSISGHTPFGVCYTKVTPQQVENYRMVIIEPDFYSAVEMSALRKTGTKIIAYVTLGEVDENRWYFSQLEEIGFVGKNDNWNSYFIDLENIESRQLILNEVIPEIIAKGVDGLFLDTIDAVSPVTDREYLQPYMVEMIEGIRNKYPKKVIIQNAGIFLLDRTKDDIDAFLTEALASDYDFVKKKYSVRSAKDFKDRLSYLNFYSEQSSKPYFIVGFADSDIKREQLITRLDTLGRPYFISNIGLSQLPIKPDSVANNLKKKIE